MKKIKLVALGISLLVLILGIMGPFSKKNNLNTQVKEVYVAVVDIPQQTIIKEEMVEKVPMLETALTGSALNTLEEVVGNVSITDIYAKDTVTKDKISEPGSQKSGVSYNIPTGERAITLDVQASSGIAGLIRVGNYIDIVNIVDDEAKLLLQNKKVIALDKKIRNEQKEAGPEQSTYMTVTLSVTPKEALELSLGDEVGQNRAILRNPEDQEIINVGSVRKP